MAKMKIIVASIAFLFGLPLILSNFIYIEPLYGFKYLSLYLILCGYLTALSVFLLIVTVLFKSKLLKKLSMICIIAMSIIVVILLVNFSIVFALHGIYGKSEFIIGANYNKFNSEKWQKSDGYGENRREYMLKDLTQNILPNKNIKEIVELLGIPYGIVLKGKTYYAYSENGIVEFRSGNMEENNKIQSYDFLDINTLYQPETNKEFMIYYITGPVFMGHSTLDIYFEKKAVFKEYKLGLS